MKTGHSASLMVVLALAASTSAYTVWAETPKDIKQDVSRQNSASHFISTAGVANIFEVEASKLALEKSRNEAIRNFAQMMVNDHSKAQQNLRTAVKNSSADPELIPDSLDAVHRMQYDRLSAATGKDFEEKYVNAMQRGHNDAVVLFSDYAKYGDNIALKEFAASTLPTLEQHKKHVSQLDDQIR